MPKLNVRCPNCDSRDVEPIYRRETLKEDRKRSKWIRLQALFWCNGCRKIIIMGYVNDEIGKKIDEKYGKAITIP